MIYLDTSVLLAHLMAESRLPPAGLWSEELTSSRLLELEAWNRVHARGLGASHGETLTLLLARIAILELDATVLGRALEPFPTPVRTLDALHLASMHYLVEQGQSLELASYDERLNEGAVALGFRLRALP